jgi:hypothetical protein
MLQSSDTVGSVVLGDLGADETAVAGGSREEIGGGEGPPSFQPAPVEQSEDSAIVEHDM